MKSKSYDKLYLRILNIGNEKLKTGLSYNELITQLKEEGYDIQNNDCFELAIQKWFYDSFNHISADDYKEFKDLKEHYECRFILNGNSSLKLIEHKTSRRSLWVAIIALVISVLSIFFSVWSNKPMAVYNHKEKKVKVEKKKTNDLETEIFKVGYGSRIIDSSSFDYQTIDSTKFFYQSYLIPGGSSGNGDYYFRLEKINEEEEFYELQFSGYLVNGGKQLEGDFINVNDFKNHPKILEVLLSKANKLISYQGKNKWLLL